MKKKILVVLGGNSREREVSLDSGKACVKAIKKIGYKVDILDPAKNQLSEIVKKKYDIIFNALHGKDGEDGNIQSYFEFLKIPYTHSGVLCSMIAMNKVLSKQIFKKKKILTPRYFEFERSIYDEKKLNLYLKKNKLNFPIVVKPTDEGSSIGVKICKNSKQLKQATTVLFKNYKNLIFEKFIGGQEIQVAVMDGIGLGAIELRPKRSFYDYKAKYQKSANTSHIMPANVSQKKYTQVLKLAERAHKALKCRGVTRADFKFYNNNFYLLEINTQPGMTNLSLVPEIAKYKKISFIELVKKIILDASINK